MSEMKQAGVLGPDASSTITLISGVSTYPLPADIDHLDSVYIEDNAGFPLIFEPENLFATRLADDRDYSGIPEFYTIPIRPGFAASPTVLGAATIQVYPVPSAAETLRLNYKANFGALTADTHVLELTDDLITTVVWGAYRMWCHVENHDDLESASQEFRLSLARGKWKQHGTIGRVYRTRFNDL